jgi:hypothetical protein
MTTPGSKNPRSPSFVPSEAKPPKSDVQKAADSLAAASRLLRRSGVSNLAVLLNQQAEAQTATEDAVVVEAQKELAPLVEQAKKAREVAVAFRDEHGQYVADLDATLQTRIAETIYRRLAVGPDSTGGNAWSFQTFRNAVADLSGYPGRVIGAIDRLTAAISDLAAEDLKAGHVSVAALKWELACACGMVESLPARLADVQAGEAKFISLIEKEGR